MNTSRRTAFTLIELLVVITILAVLAALLMPALSSAKDRSKTLQCANNQRQLAMGFEGYLNDRSGYYPYAMPECPLSVWCPLYNMNWNGVNGSAGCVDSPGWNWCIAPSLNCPTNILAARTGCNLCAIVGCCPKYVMDAFTSYARLVQCPSNLWPFPTTNFYANWRLVPTGYVMNADMFPVSWRNCGGAGCACLPGYEDPHSPTTWNKRVNVSDISHPSAVLLLGESPLDYNILDNPWGKINGGGWGYTLPYASNVGLAATLVTNSTSTAWGGVSPDPRWWLLPNANAYVATWHNLSMNCLFADGHVDRVSKSTLYTNSVQRQALVTGPNGTPGGLFWTDGKGTKNGMAWYAWQYPGGPYPQ